MEEILHAVAEVEKNTRIVVGKKAISGGNLEINVAMGTFLKTNNYIAGNDKEVVLIESSANIDLVKKIVGERKVLAILLTHDCRL